MNDLAVRLFEKNHYAKVEIEEKRLQVKFIYTYTYNIFVIYHYLTSNYLLIDLSVRTFFLHFCVCVVLLI